MLDYTDLFCLQSLFQVFVFMFSELILANFSIYVPWPGVIPLI